jgi:hypothetical protein
MTYDIHPIVVHFPIALLFLYSVIKILPLDKWLPRVSWRDIERFLLFIGVIGAFIARTTGEMIGGDAPSGNKLLEMHELFASITLWLYGILLVGEIFAIFNGSFIAKLNIAPLSKIGNLIEKIICNKYLSILIAILALVSITVTGMLGGVMVHGLSADPFAPMVLNMLGISI